MDPIWEAGGINLYGFANNNPISYIDPEGTNPVLIVIGVAAGGYIAYQAISSIIDWWRASECAKQANIEEQRRFGKPESYMEYERYSNRDKALRNAAIKGFEVGQNVPGTSFTGPAPMGAADAIIGAATDIVQKPVTSTIPVMMENYR
jgi:hypothetical protein